jgi:hypothetical protein
LIKKLIGRERSNEIFEKIVNKKTMRKVPVVKSTKVLVVRIISHVAIKNHRRSIKEETKKKIVEKMLE